MATTVMIVDDSLFMRKMLRDLLESQGYEVVAEAADGVEAVTRFQETRPHLTTMDVFMPNRTGLEALREIRSIDSAARVVMCSSIAQEALTEEAARAGAVDFLLKPFDPEVVERVVRKASEG